MSKAWLVACNLATAASWAYVFLLIVTHLSELSTTADGGESAIAADAFCTGSLTSSVNMALLVSFLEVLNCVLGFTKSPLPAVLLFACTRMGVERIIAPMIPCRSWQHIITVSCWAMGDTVRFGSLASITANPATTNIAKSIRFTVGPILFPIGAGGEMLMVILAASYSEKAKVWYYGAAALWPIFFYPMMKQLLKQRQKHFNPPSKKKQIKSV